MGNPVETVDAETCIREIKLTSRDINAPFQLIQFYFASFTDFVALTDQQPSSESNPSKNVQLEH
jgi:hypothetical protein